MDGWASDAEKTFLLCFDKILQMRGRVSSEGSYGAKKAMSDLTTQKGDCHLFEWSG